MSTAPGPDRGKAYPAEDIVVTFDRGRCLHSQECARGLPEVFDTAKDPWIDPTRAPAERIAEAISRCPSGALRYTLTGGAPEEPIHPTRVTVVADGPLVLHGHMVVAMPDGTHRHETRAALCRCGSTGNAPFCDGSAGCGLTGKDWGASD
ncbi:(4Fe-4S)-binding protein [Embleya sp. NBC_00896]|uniref:(4Fe-4S)-binding protein n=1 Tax=Embleya sp. NBC_00896 TaxID=2975961 RepID=UPI0038647B43|nr:(4Fe-4S)-binding protein [Embleya sp. NBC_00896]